MMVKAGVIGTGNMGKHHARVYSELGCLSAVSDMDQGKSRDIGERFGCRHYSDHNEMLEKEDLDCVSICVPTVYHRAIALDCIAKGVHVLVEKPISNTVESAREMIDSARARGVKLGVGHIERFNPAVMKLKEIIDSGELGKVNTIIARRVGAFPPQIKDANVVIDLAVHDIDIFNLILGKRPQSGYAVGGRALINNREDFADILFDYGSVSAFIEANWITPVKIRKLSITGSEGYAELNYITQELVVHKSEHRKIDTFNDVVEFGTPRSVIIPVEKDEPLRLELQSFLERVGRGQEPEVTGEDGLNALEIALLALSSLRGEA